MNDEEIIWCSTDISINYGFTNSIINDAMMDGMDWKEVIGVYIEHNLLPQKLRDKIVHNR